MGISVTAHCQYLVGGERSLHCTFLCAPSMVGVDSFDLATLQAASVIPAIDARSASNDEKLNVQTASRRKRWRR
jgi:hypothetical protein